MRGNSGRVIRSSKYIHACCSNWTTYWDWPALIMSRILHDMAATALCSRTVHCGSTCCSKVMRPWLRISRLKEWRQMANFNRLGTTRCYPERFAATRNNPCQLERFGAARDDSGRFIWSNSERDAVTRRSTGARWPKARINNSEAGMASLERF
jgi:hypothetical protein